MLDLKLCLTEARDAVAEGAALALKSFRTGFSVRLKADRTPVTEVDVAVEEIIRTRLARRFPQIAFFGEESGASDSAESRTRWILDPIDGTENFIAGIPIFATLLGLEHDGQIVLGVVEAPAMRERAWAVRGEGAWLNGERIHVSSCTDLRQAFLVYGSSGDFARHGTDRSWRELVATTRRQRGFGDYYGHLLVAAGRADIMIDAVVAPYDIAALQVIVAEAGGQLTDFAGRASIYGHNAVSTNGKLHEAVIALLSER
jgi:histidinol phosphatase-like enzyme (inositol monophosphatase family)